MFYLSEYALTWVRGSQSYRLIDETKQTEIEHAQAAVAAIIGECRSCSPGGMARELLAWIGHKQHPSELAAESLRECGWHFQCWKPGTYQHAQLYDLRGAYFQLLCRLRGPDAVWTRNAILDGLAAPQSEERWRRVLDAVKGLKLVRNCLVGAMIGGSDGHHCWHKGEVRKIPSKRGPLFNTGALIVRTLYEVCELEAEHQETVYANTDSVMIEGEAKPVVWPELGLGYRLEAEGEATVRGIGVYAIGEKRTRWFGLTQFDQPEWCSPKLASTGTWQWLRR
jgi:hypothetical protein